MSDHEPCCAACGGAGADMSGPCSDCYGTGCAHPPMTVIDRAAEALLEEWGDRVEGAMVDSDVGHTRAFAERLDADDLLVTAEHDRKVIEKFLRERDTPSVRIENADMLLALMATAWDHGFDAGATSEWAVDDDEIHPPNPYRKGETDDRR